MKVSLEKQFDQKMPRWLGSSGRFDILLRSGDLTVLLSVVYGNIVFFIPYCRLFLHAGAGFQKKFHLFTKKFCNVFVVLASYIIETGIFKAVECLVLKAIRPQKCPRKSVLPETCSILIADVAGTQSKLSLNGKY